MRTTWGMRIGGQVQFNMYMSGQVQLPPHALSPSGQTMASRTLHALLSLTQPLGQVAPSYAGYTSPLHRMPTLV